MICLGISGFSHDSAVALVKDGEVLFALEHERLTRVKGQRVFPTSSVNYSLKYCNIDKSDIDEIIYYWDDVGGLWEGIFSEMKNCFRPNIATSHRILRRCMAARSNDKVTRVITRLWQGYPAPVIRFIDHHLSHAQYAAKTSGYDEAVVFVVDGRGESSSLSVYLYQHGSFIKLNRSHMPDSLNYLYGAVTQHLGFKPIFDEHRVMGLAPFGQHDPILDEYFRRRVKVNRGRLKLDTRFFNFHNGESTDSPWLSDKSLQYLGMARRHNDPLEPKHKNIAYALQDCYEKSLKSIIDHFRSYFPQLPVILTGGGAMNSVFNGKLLVSGSCKSIYIPVAPGNQGSAIGAALSPFIHRQCQRNLEQNRSARLGPAFTTTGIIPRLTARGYSWHKPHHLGQAVAMLLERGQIGGVFDGRMEFGPRALGARSIIASPRYIDVRDKINSSLKLRELFRPFAGSILQEYLADWTTVEKNDSYPYMNMVFTLREDKVGQIPAICHIDGSCRLQTVTAKDGLFHDLILSFYRLTGIPIILNTSFNKYQEPIVMSPQDALYCFEKSNLDFLVINDLLVTR
ncbi:carbamoyltransferase family protein [Biostraticola tofi]|uniref:Carbamoyltransferase n=1 Tax=Biostraticola tofi TaxID=466109 RepID=A0A4R3YJY4_9GAMM|nr:carbamoyltransferase C-terminal domain-containing protein [Biostraticola tofi]TCV92481.1 carbamoyltransferase [Biostraticola tofi]